MISQLLRIAGVSVPNKLPENVSKVSSEVLQEATVFQLPLFDNQDVEDSKSRQDLNCIKVPTELADTQASSRSLAPKILWAMVELRARGKKQVTGAEITKIINQYLVDDINKVESTNISRALREKTLQSQDWLCTEHTESRKKLYGLSDTWYNYWEQTFKEPSPSLD
jgi:hypothetical protein